VFSNLKRKLQKRFAHAAFMKNELSAADFVSSQVPALYALWQPAFVQGYGPALWSKFENSKFWYGYIFGWCDLLARSCGAEPGGTGALTGFVRVVRALQPGLAEESMDQVVEGFIQQVQARDPDILLGGDTANMDFADFSHGAKSPVGLLGFLDVLQKANLP